ncbi:TonB-dependent receptor domain-containing protein [Sphingomonas sanguinis]|jgi:outer membrane receptor protein involved in Fe transport|uniref:TonB-dependent receptor n=2 Tax=Sphingomonas sanguinis TaxID=33051 RepID=A0A7Y7QWH9_9SPHN|nr:TonB-dependent receptor [Sphingomonas sanguinis]MBZ6382418.1 TonB-dependent receptor [Sphingomonas sanguinis]NNG50609.1 TonB-dependent receptor [Sphingomonas sanguinis]NNG54687.1 TonB-dependent receptor [Sphingomonas sanguinis]NVP31716.1 TonB-dependent receptor [Sphingomonas sanguinis]
MASTIDRARMSRGISALAMAAALVVSAPAYAQATGTLRGHVEGASAGTSVKITDLTTGQVITVRTNASGDYTIPGIRPSTYRVEVQGQQPEQVVVPIGQIITADIGEPAAAAGSEVAAGGAASGDVVVTGRRTQEVRTAEVSTNVSQQQIESLPQSDRNFLNFAALAPGVAVTPGRGNRQVQAGGVSADNVNVFIDGLSLKNQVNHGGVAGQNFSQGNPFPQLAVQEFKVDTQNYKAEYEQAGSAIITAVTKTGGDSYHGTLFGEWQPSSFYGTKYFDRPGQRNNQDGTRDLGKFDRKQYGADLGGPIIKDVLHIYGAFEATDQKAPSAAVLLGQTVSADPTQNVPQAIANQYNGSYPQDFSQRLYFGKLTGYVSAADTVNLSGFFRRESNLADFGGTSVPSHGHLLQSKIDLYQLEWNHRGDHWLNELTIAYNSVFNGTPRTSSGPEINLGKPGAVVAQLGTNGFEQFDNQKTWTFKNNVTFFGDRHVVKAGVKVSLNDLSRAEDNLGNGGYYFQPSTFTSFDASTPQQAAVSVVPVRPATAKDTQIGLFIQDDWTVDDHLTINAGLRWDYETNAKNEKFVTPTAIANALRNYQPWQAAGINPNDYISTGTNRKPYWKAFQPRLGISYDLNGDRDTIFFAGAGRYYDRPLFIASGIETVKQLYQQTVTLSFCDGPGQPSCASIRATNNGALPAATLAWNNNYKNVDALRAAATATGVGGEVWLLNNDTKLPYSDQFNIGFRKRLGVVQTSVTFSHIRSYNIFKYVRGNRLPSGQYTSQGDQWIEDNFPAQGILPGYSGKLNIGSNAGKAVYNALYFTAEKPFVTGSKWGFTATLTVQQAKSNVAQELQGDEFYNGPRMDAYGWNYVAGVEKWRFVGTGIAKGPWDTKISVTGTFSSGPSFGQVIFPANPPENANAYGNFGGVFWPDQIVGYASVDLRIAKNFKMPWGHDLEVNFAAFNLFDSVNRTYSAWGAGSGVNPTKREFDTTGVPRSFQVGARYKF